MKTIEESFDDFFFNLKKNHDVVDYLLNKKSFGAGVKFAQRWTSVEEELPNLGDDIILKLREHPLKKYQVWHIADDYDIKLVPVYATHWRPIELK